MRVSGSEMRRSSNRLAVAVAIVALSAPLRAQQAPVPSDATFKSNVNLILVDVVVRDRSGAVVSGLTQDDFQILEDNKAQQIVSFAFERDLAKPPDDRDGLAARGRGEASRRDTRRLCACGAGRCGGADIGGRRRASTADAAVRHELDAAGGRAEGRRFRADVGQ